jgi:hypothetical protein
VNEYWQLARTTMLSGVVLGHTVWRWQKAFRGDGLMREM